MENYKQEFIDFMVESSVLKFGDFTLKSGRKSPFFMNAGSYVTGTQLRKLGEYYAKAIHDNFGLDFDVLFGPAYKGIPLSVATTMAISELYGKDIRYCSNRKEVKDHGDTGILLGSPIKDGDKVVIIEDVTTSGKSIEETFPIIKAQGDVEIKGLMVSLNRMEMGLGGKMKGLDAGATEDAEANLKRTESIIYSMTAKERSNPDILNPSRKNRIARGAGVDISEVNKLVKQFDQMKKMMKQMPGMMKGAKKGRFKLPF